LSGAFQVLAQDLGYIGLVVNTQSFGLLFKVIQIPLIDPHMKNRILFAPFYELARVFQGLTNTSVFLGGYGDILAAHKRIVNLLLLFC
jgi:hypothetical protein